MGGELKAWLNQVNGELRERERGRGREDEDMHSCARICSKGLYLESGWSTRAKAQRDFTGAFECH